MTATPIAVVRKAAEHNISRPEAKRVIAAVERVQAAKAPETYIEWTGNIQVHHPVKPPK